MDGLSAASCKKGSSARSMSNRSHSRPARRSTSQLLKVVPPAGWTMCECEADKDWVLCDRVEALQAQLAQQFQQHLQQSEETAPETVAPEPSVKEATLKRVQLQLMEEDAEERRAEARGHEEDSPQEASAGTEEEVDAEQTEEERREERRRKLAMPRPESARATRASSRRAKREPKDGEASQQRVGPVLPAQPVVEEPSQAAATSAEAVDWSKKDMTRAERKVAWRAAQALEAVSPQLSPQPQPLPQVEQVQKQAKKSDKRASKESEDADDSSSSKQRSKSRRSSNRSQKGE